MRLTCRTVGVDGVDDLEVLSKDRNTGVVDLVAELDVVSAVDVVKAAMSTLETKLARFLFLFQCLLCFTIMCVVEVSSTIQQRR